MRDVLLIARFEVLRAIRTWRALALVVLVSVAMGGGAYLFTRFIGLMENQLATQLGVARTRVPGAMLQELVTSDSYRDVVTQVFGDPAMQEWILQLHPAALFYFGLATLVLPFFAATASAESLSIDVQSRAIRFEALRTSRLDLVAGRFLGQASILTFAVIVAAATALIVTALSMRVAQPVSLMIDVLRFSLRAWVFGMPFVGLGIAASQLTSSPAWARVLAIGATLGTWGAVAFGPWLGERLGVIHILDVVLLTMPQRHLDALWGPGNDWLFSGFIELVLALVATVAAFPVFARRNL
ncbi:MAG: ABC transporter permease subunit [Myxococcota bacterium]